MAVTRKILSVIVPVYNEEKTIKKVLDRLSKEEFGIKKEIIIVNDGSTDKTKEIIEKHINSKKGSPRVQYKFIDKLNGGKGSAVKIGIRKATGDIITIQDADLEYDPKDYKKLIKPILENKFKVVYGSRFMLNHQPLYKIYFFR